MSGGEGGCASALLEEVSRVVDLDAETEAEVERRENLGHFGENALSTSFADRIVIDPDRFEELGFREAREVGEGHERLKFEEELSFPREGEALKREAKGLDLPAVKPSGSTRLELSLQVVEEFPEAFARVLDARPHGDAGAVRFGVERVEHTDER